VFSLRGIKWWKTRSRLNLICISSFLITVIFYALFQMLLNHDCHNYKLISEAHREEFLFRLFKHLCLGGQWCQYEDNIKPYINTTKVLYKDIIR
jgi:hypothetical protein